MQPNKRFINCKKRISRQKLIKPINELFAFRSSEKSSCRVWFLPLFTKNHDFSNILWLKASGLNYELPVANLNYEFYIILFIIYILYTAKNKKTCYF